MIDRNFTSQLGFHRAKVIDNKDEQKYGRVKVWIPDFMPLIPDNQGIWARPANNVIGGRNKDDNCNYAGTSYIPTEGSWLWVFFESQNLNRPYYFAPLDLENAHTLPECRVGTEYQKKWVIFKSTEGRTIVISDDPDDARVEITGKKRQISDPPEGDESSVYTIDGNQTTILLDERSGKEKILIKTYKGDFLHIDIDERKLQAFFEEGISFKTNKIFCIECKDFNVKASNSIKQSGVTIDSKASGAQNIEGNPVNIKSGGALNAEAAGVLNAKAGGNLNADGGGQLNLKGGSGAALSAGGVVTIDGTSVSEMGGGSAAPAGSASGAADANACPVEGERDT